MRLTYKYRIYANNETIANAERWLELCRQLYNAALEQRIIAYKSNHTALSLYCQQKQISELRTSFDEYGLINAHVLRSPLVRLDRAYRRFFKHGGYPRFKGRNRYHSFTLYDSGWKLDGKYLRIKNLGTFKLRLSRDITGDVKEITIKCDLAGRWYAFFSCADIPLRSLPKTNQSIGIDVGIKSFCFDSDGNRFDNPQYFRKSQAELRRRQRSLARRVKGSNHRNKARQLVAKSHSKIQNQRNDFLHKTANYYISNYDNIYVEDLAIPNMVRNHHLAKSITDSAWGKFFEYLMYKAEGADRQVFKIPRFEPTSKTCSECGEINQDLTLNDRQWVCKSCGTLHDRDYNAAKNILRVGQTLQAITCASGQSVACESQEECQGTKGNGDLHKKARLGASVEGVKYSTA